MHELHIAKKGEAVAMGRKKDLRFFLFNAVTSFPKLPCVAPALLKAKRQGNRNTLARLLCGYRYFCFLLSDRVLIGNCFHIVCGK